MLRMILASLIWLACGTTIGLAQDASSSAQPLAVFAPAIGTHHATWTAGEAVVLGDCEIKWGTGQGCVIMTSQWRPHPEKGPANLPELIEGHRIYTWDYAKRRVTMALASSTGLSATGEYRVSENQLMGQERIVGSDGVVEFRDVILTIEDDGSIRSESRRDESLQVTQWQCPEKQSSLEPIPSAVLDQFELLVGDWFMTGETAQGPAESKVTLSWAPGKHLLIFHSKWKSPKFSALGSGVFGWDALEQQVHMSEFWNNNVYHHRHFKPVGDDRWEGEEFSGASIDGQALRGKSRIVFVDRDHWRFESTEITADGEPREPFQLDFHRQAKD